MKSNLIKILLLSASMMMAAGCVVSPSGSSSSSQTSISSSILSSIQLSGDYPTSFYQGDAFSYEGLIVTATYSDGSSKEVTGFTVTTPDMSTLGEQNVVVTYTEKDITKRKNYTINILEKVEPPSEVTLSSIALSGDYPTEFYVDDPFTYTGLIVTAIYSDDTSKEVTGFTVSTPDMSRVGKQDVTVTYEEGSISRSMTYSIRIYSILDDLAEIRAEAKEDLGEAFNELDIEDYAQNTWERIISAYNEALDAIDASFTEEEILDAKEAALDVFSTAVKSSDVVKGTLYDIASSTVYEFGRDEEGHIVISYPSYPGDWKYVGTSKNLASRAEGNNRFELTIRNDFDQEITACLQLTDGGSYKVDSHRVSIGALATYTFALDYEGTVNHLYFFVDSCLVHDHGGQITIMEETFTYHEVEYSTKTVAINEAFDKDDNANTVYTLGDVDHAPYIERVDAIVEVLHNGNDSSHRYFGLRLSAGSNNITLSDSLVHAQEIKEQDATTGQNVTVGDRLYLNLPIEETSKLAVGKNISMAVSYAAAGLTFSLVSYQFHYGLWKESASEQVEVNADIYVNGSSKDDNNIAYKAIVPYASFNNKGRVKAMDVSFTIVNNASYGKSQIHFSGIQFTTFSSGNNNVLNIGSLMDKTGSGVETSGTMRVYPTNDIDLTSENNIIIECWWSSATYIRVDSITLITDSLQVPDAVQGLEAHPIDGGAVLNWDASSGATSYDVYVNDQLYGNTIALYLTINGLDNDASYSFYVIAKNATGASPASDSVSCTPQEGATYDTFIEGLNTNLEQSIGETNMATLLTNASDYASIANNARLKSVIAKMQSGEETNIVFMGGSITVGEGATQKDENNHSKGYAYYTYQWLKRNYDAAGNSHFINASISGTDTEIALHRVQKDVFDHNPDLIFIEFAANNGTNSLQRRTFEALLRKCQNQMQDPAIVLVFSATYYTGGVEDYMSAIGEYYNLPMYSINKGLRSVCTPTRDRNDPIFAAYSEDSTHPTDEGHQLMSKGLCYFLRNQINDAEDTKNNYPTAPSNELYDQYDSLTALDHENGSEYVSSLGSFVATDTSTYATSSQSDVTGFQKGWKKNDTESNEAMVVELNCKDFFFVYCAGNTGVEGDPRGTLVVSYVNLSDSEDSGEISFDVTNTMKQNTDDLTSLSVGGNGWGNPVCLKLFASETASNYQIRFQMSEASGTCSIMALGYVG